MKRLTFPVIFLALCAVIFAQNEQEFLSGDWILTPYFEYKSAVNAVNAYHTSHFAEAVIINFRAGQEAFIIDENGILEARFDLTAGKDRGWTIRLTVEQEIALVLKYARVDQDVLLFVMYSPQEPQKVISGIMKRLLEEELPEEPLPSEP